MNYWLKTTLNKIELEKSLILCILNKNKNKNNMNKYKLALCMVLVAPNSFALNKQIEAAEKYHFSMSGVVLVKNGLNSVKDLVNSDILVDKKTPEESFVAVGRDIYPGNKSEKFKQLQKQWGLPETGIYEKILEKKVKQLQVEKGLNPTGIIDKNTWFAIYEQPLPWKVKTVNKAIENWVGIIEKNKNHPSNKMIVINIPSMKLYLYQKNEFSSYDLIMESRVVVGRTKTKTPLNDFELISLKYNPTWTPTKNMLKRNLYKNGELNVKWLEDHGLNLLDEEGNLREYDDLINLQSYKFIQASGDGNALGNLKFETTSKEDIYLHDTNERHLFNYNTRLFSSGCIRVQDYIKLAGHVSERGTQYVEKNIGKEKTFFDRLPKRVPVYFDYSQVYFSEEEKLSFYDDVYSVN